MESIPREVHKYKKGIAWVYDSVIIMEYNDPNDTIKMLMKKYELFK